MSTTTPFQPQPQPHPQLLPYELLLAQLSTLELCHALFPLEGELSLSSSTVALLPRLREYVELCEMGGGKAGPWAEAGGGRGGGLEFTLRLRVRSSVERGPASGAASDPPEAELELQLSVILPLHSPLPSPSPSPSPGLPPPLLILHHPPALSRAAHAALSEALHASLVEGGNDGERSGTELILSALDFLREHTHEYLPPPPSAVASDGTPDGSVESPLVRVWFWFPSLSTREKREDLVRWAPGYGLTGFVLAGKPALLCVEGTAANIDAYMVDIKSNSWADIPSFQKKVSERHRELLSPSSSVTPSPPSTPSTYPTSHPSTPSPTSQTGRAFTKMEEITSLVTRSGARGNRGDMGEVRDWLVARGLGRAFGEVVGGGDFV